MTLEAIKQQIESLPEQERSALFRWLEQREQAEWDAEIERDFSGGGRGMALLEELKREMADNKTRPLDEGLADRSRKGT